MPSPCSAYRNVHVPEGKSRPRCIVDVRFGCCSECVRKGYSSYDITVTWTEWERLREQRRRLKRKLEEAKEKVTEAMTYVHRLRKQLRVAEEREEKAITKEFTALQELPSEVSEDPSDFLLEPEGEPSEIAEVFQCYGSDDRTRRSDQRQDERWKTSQSCVARLARVRDSRDEKHACWNRPISSYTGSTGSHSRQSRQAVYRN